jgi:hypothetical protein
MFYIRTLHMLKRSSFVYFDIDSEDWAIKVYLCKFSEGRRKVQKPTQNRECQTYPSEGTEELVCIFQLPYTKRQRSQQSHSCTYYTTP